MLCVNVPKWGGHVFSPVGVCTDSVSIVFLIFLCFPAFLCSGSKAL